jgi:hypothetical protein
MGVGRGLQPQATLGRQGSLGVAAVTSCSSRPRMSSPALPLVPYQLPAMLPACTCSLKY